MSIIGIRPFTEYERAQEAYLEQLRISNRMRAEKNRLKNEKELSDYIAYGPTSSEVF